MRGRPEALDAGTAHGADRPAATPAPREAHAAASQAADGDGQWLAGARWLPRYPPPPAVKGGGAPNAHRQS